MNGGPAGFDPRSRPGVRPARRGLRRLWPLLVTAVLMAGAPPGGGGACVAQVKVPAQVADAGPNHGLPWASLFNGRNLEGWEVVEGDADDWSVVDGVLACAGREHGWLGTKERYDNFRLLVEFRLPAGGDSGVFVRAADEGNPAFEGLEVQLLDDRADEYRNQPEHGRCGGIYGVAGPARLLSRPAGEWQTLEIVCGVDRVTTILNGEVATEVGLAKAAEGHAGAARTTGRIGLQSWGTPVEFRLVRIQSLGRSG